MEEALIRRGRFFEGGSYSRGARVRGFTVSGAHLDGILSTGRWAYNQEGGGRGGGVIRENELLAAVYGVDLPL